jgi:cytochrome c553
MSMSKRFLVAAGVALAALSTLAMSADYEAGKKLVTEKNCASCHGEQGNKPITPETPKLAGQYADYLEHALTAYKKGKRQNPMMSPMAQNLSKEEIRNLAYYFSKQQGLFKKY